MATSAPTAHGMPRVFQRDPVAGTDAQVVDGLVDLHGCDNAGDGSINSTYRCQQATGGQEQIPLCRTYRPRRARARYTVLYICLD